MKTFKDYLIEAEEIPDGAAKLLASDNEYTRAEAIEEYPVEAVFDAALKDDNKVVRRALAMNNKTPAKYFKILMNDKNDVVIGALVTNKSVSPEIINTTLNNKLTSRNFNELFMNSHLNPDFTSETLDIIANKGGIGGKSLVAGRDSISTSTLKTLADDENDHVRYMAAGNKSIPGNLLIKLANDESRSVRISARDNPLFKSIDGDKLNNLDDEDLLSTASILRKSRSKFSSARMDAAESVNADPRVLNRLSKDENIGVRRSVIENPKVSDKVLIGMIDDSRNNAQILAKIVKFTNSAKVLNKLVDKYEETESWLLRNYLQDNKVLNGTKAIKDRFYKIKDEISLKSQ